MRISFSPLGCLPQEPKVLVLEKGIGDRIRINGELFNFDPLNDGDTIPADDIPCEWIAGHVEKIDGEVRLTVRLPHGPNPSQAVAFPAPITVTAEGPIAIPHDEEPADVDA